MANGSGYPRAQGDDELDVTAYLLSQRDWDLEGDDGPANIPPDVLYKFANTGRQTPTYRVSWMFDEGRVVLDLNNHPVKDYGDIPLTLSSQVEGSLMEIILRLDPRIKNMDLWARL